MKQLLLLTATVFYLINHTNAQQLDASFGSHGIIEKDLGKRFSYASGVKQVLVQSDGSIYLVIQSETQTVITKRHADGLTDLSYGSNGFSNSVKMSVSSATLQQSGKIVIAGSVNEIYGQFDIAVVRFTANGSLDSSFSDDGLQTKHFIYSTNYPPEVTVIGSNEKIVVAVGNLIFRYNADGTADSSFNGGAIQTDDFEINRATIQSDEKIVVAGNVGKFFSSEPSVYIVARYNTDGSPDRSFGNNGKQITYVESLHDLPNSIAIQKDGKILAGGKTIVRYNTDGSLDSTFSGDGMITTDFYVIYYETLKYSLTLQDDQKIIIAGNIGDESNYSAAVARYNTDGSTDSAFSEDGMLSTNFIIASAASQNDGKILAAGSADADFVIARFAVNGTPDKTFGTDGKLTDNIHSGYTIFTAEAILKDGKILAAGTTWNGKNLDFAVARFNKDGSDDNTFGNSGVQTTDIASSNDYLKSLFIQPDGKFVVAGYSDVVDNKVLSIARYNSVGSPDSTFNNTGKLQTAFSGHVNIIYSVVVQSDGKIIAGGLFGLARFNADGSIDKTFGSSGRQVNVFLRDEQGASAFPSSVAIQSDGKIVAGGIYFGNNTIISVARLNADGTRDNTFTQYSSAGSQISLSVAIQSDGKIVAGGYSFFGKNENYVVRLNTDGTLDTSFGLRVTSVENTEDYPYDNLGNSVALQSDGKIVVSGTAFTRYNTNGNLDSTFGKNGVQTIPGQNNVNINAIAISANKLYGVGATKAPGVVGLAARYLLSNNPPTVRITTPTDNAYYIEAGNIKLTAAASDSDGTISKVEFYNGNILLHTEYVAPYGYQWKNVSAGNYTLTARATDNNGQITVSAAIHITVVSKNDFNVSIVSPANNEVYAAPAYVHLRAEVNNPHGKIVRVEFYNGSTLLRNEYKYPYTYVWRNVPEGIYYITAKAIDEQGNITTSETITIKVIPRKTIVSNKPYSETEKTALNDALSLRLSPNPASNIVNIYTSGLQQNKPATLSIISVSGIVLKTMQIGNAATQLDLLSLASGVYSVKIISGNKVLHKQFVKL